MNFCGFRYATTSSITVFYKRRFLHLLTVITICSLVSGTALLWECYCCSVDKVPSIRSFLGNVSASEYDYIDVHLDAEYMKKAYARLQSVVENLLLEPVTHQRWFRKSPQRCSLSFHFIVASIIYRQFVTLLSSLPHQREALKVCIATVCADVPLRNYSLRKARFSTLFVRSTILVHSAVT